MKHFSLRLGDGLHAELVALADRERRSLQRQLIVLLEQALTAPQALAPWRAGSSLPSSGCVAVTSHERTS